MRVVRIGTIRFYNADGLRGVRGFLAGALVRLARVLHKDAGSVFIPAGFYIRTPDDIVVGPGTAWRSPCSVFAFGDLRDLPERYARGD